MKPADTSLDAWKVQIKIYRRLTPAGRLRTAFDLTNLARGLTRAGIGARNPDLAPERVSLALRDIWLRRLS